MKHPKKDPVAYNYCVSFIDLLAQRKALEGQGLLPVFKSEDDKNAFDRTLRDTVGAIRTLQERSDIMIRAVLKPQKKSPFRASLAPELQAECDEMQRTRVTVQRWSDGLVHFACLGDKDIKCVMNGIFSIFASAGSLCFMGLARQRAVRGSIDIAWGVELHKGELYGAAVARAYELESEYADYPRIVVSPRVVEYLRMQLARTANDRFTQFDQSLAHVCLEMLAPDADGLQFLHYLGNGFRNYVTREQHTELYSRALAFVTGQLEQFRATGNTKLAFRYSHLLLYFRAHAPVEDGACETQQPAAALAPQATRR